LGYKTFETDFRDYLWKERDPRQLARILIQVGQGLKELHNLGYVHRDLKPENIVLNLKPLEVRLIDFGRSMFREETTIDSEFGTPGYVPFRPQLQDGDPAWDIWAFAMIILESDLEHNVYLKVNS
jgi:serine/threonine protein kinase